MSGARQVFFRSSLFLTPMCALGSTLGALGLGLVACSSSTPQGAQLPVSVEMSKKFSPRSINEIVILPFEAGLGQNIPDSALEEAGKRLIHSVQLNTTLSVKNISDPNGVEQAVNKYIPRKGTPREQAVYVARDLGVQAALSGVLSKYTELDGSVLGSETPAAVGATLWLTDVNTGEVLWSARFADNQRPLSENIFRARRNLSGGIGNVSASEMLDSGFREALRRLESERASSPAVAR